MNSLANLFRSAVFQRAVFLVSILLLIIYGTWRHVDYRVHIEDDLIWSYQMGTDLNPDGEEIFRKRDLFLSYLDEQNAAPVWSQRAVIRAKLDYYKNYLAGNVLVNLVAKAVVVSDIAAPTDYPTYLASTYLGGFIAQIVLVAVFAFGIMYFVSDRKFLAMISCTLIYILVFDYFETSTPHGFISQKTLGGNWTAGVENFFTFLVSPQMSFSPFYPPFKSRLVVLIFAVFVLRWRGHHAASYWLLFIAAFFHQGYGGIAILFVLAVDLISQPKKLQNVWIGLPILLGIVSYVVRDGTIREALAATNFLLAVAIPLVAATLFFLFIRQIGRLRLMFYAPVERLLNGDRIAIDITIFGLLWLGSLIAFIPISLSVDTLSSSQFWGLVHGRILGVFHPVIILAAFLGIFSLVEKWISRSSAIALVMAFTTASTLVFYVLAFRNFESPRSVHLGLYQGFSQIDKMIEQPLPEFRGLKSVKDFKVTHGELVESLVYYSISKSAETGEDHHSQLFQK